MSSHEQLTALDTDRTPKLPSMESGTIIHHSSKYFRKSLAHAEYCEPRYVVSSKALPRKYLSTPNRELDLVVKQQLDGLTPASLLFLLLSWQPSASS